MNSKTRTTLVILCGLLFLKSFEGYASESDTLAAQGCIIFIHNHFFTKKNSLKLLMDESPIRNDFFKLRKKQICDSLSKYIPADELDSLYNSSFNPPIKFKWSRSLINFAEIIPDSEAGQIIVGMENTYKDEKGNIIQSNKEKEEIISMSYPVFSKNGTYAIIRIQTISGSLTGRRDFYLLKRLKNKTWVELLSYGDIS